MSAPLTQEQFARAQFVGVYRKPDRPNMRVPVRHLDGKHYDLFGVEIDLSQYVEVSA